MSRYLAATVIIGVMLLVAAAHFADPTAQVDTPAASLASEPPRTKAPVADDQGRSAPIKDRYATRPEAIDDGKSISSTQPPSSSSDL